MRGARSTSHQARRSAGNADNQVRVRDQPQDREGARRESLRQSSDACRGGNRVTSLMAAFRTKCESRLVLVTTALSNELRTGYASPRVLALVTQDPTSDLLAPPFRW